MKNILVNLSGRTNSGPAIALEIAKGLIQNDCNVYAIVSKDALNINDWIAETRIKKILILKTYTNIQNLIPDTIKFICKDKEQVSVFFNGIEFDYVINPIFHFWDEAIISKVKYKKVISICHDPMMHSGENLIRKILHYLFIKRSDEIIVLTHKFIPIIRKFGFTDEKIHYMPHGLLPKYKMEQKKYYVPLAGSEEVKFLFFGRIEKYKGIQVLLDAYRILYAKSKNISLIIAGKGNLKPFSKSIRKLQNVVIENRYIDDNEVGCFFDDPNTVLVLPYLDATQSGVVAIAMEYGVPVIASDVGGLAEQLGDGKAGLFVNPRNPIELAEKMELFIYDKSMFKNQRRIMLELSNKLNWSQIIHDYLCFIIK